MTTDYKFAGTAANVDRDSKVAWSNPDSAKADDSSNAVCDVAKNTYGDWLRLTNYGFTTGDIPSGSIINGIEVAIGHYGENSTNLRDSAIYLRKTSGQVGSNYASGTNWNASPIQEITYGDSTNKWGTTWSVDDILNSDFGIDFSAANNNGTAARNAYVDYIKIRIYYDTPITYNSGFFNFFNR